MNDDTTTNDATACKHGQLARSCEMCLMQEAIDTAIEERNNYRERCNKLSDSRDALIAAMDRVLAEVRDRYAQAALTGLNANPAYYEAYQEEIIGWAFKQADLAMKRRKQR